MKKYPIAFSLGLGSFFLFWGIGEYLGSMNTTSAIGIAAGLLVLAGALGAYAFVCQWYLSRGDARTLREQWPLLLCFNIVLTAFALAVAVFVHKWIPTLTMVGLAAYSWACSCAGAVIAARTVRRSVESNVR
jgi:hypothetical protein